MHYFTFAEKDTTLYERSGSRNTGLDEILEIRKDKNANASTINVSRALIKFDLTTLSNYITSGLITSGSSTRFYLNLFDANSTGLSTSQTLYSYPVSQSWENGSGREDSNPQISDGCSWFYKDNDISKTLWANVTSSGGTWYSGSGYEASQSFTNEPSDVRMDVTDIVWKWHHSIIPNEGFMVKRRGNVGNTDTNSDEGGSSRLGNFSFFSSDTNTKYPPTLEVVWDDSSWTIGSLSSLSSTELEDSVVYMKGLRPEYKEKSKAKFRVVGRERFPSKTFSATPAGLTVKAFPSSSFYSILDAETNDVIVPYGTGSKLSCDSSGNYFNLDLNGYQPERYYKIEYRIQSGSGTTDELDQYFDEGFTFKVSQ